MMYLLGHIAVLRMQLRRFVTDRVAWSVCLSVGHSSERCQNMPVPIKMPFGLRTRVDPSNHVLDGVQITPWEGAFFEGNGRPILKYRDVVP